MLYSWIKALHIISVISLMAGLLYLPRLFVYHADAAKGSPQSDMLKMMEYRLLRYICTPALIATWIFGLWLLYLQPYLLHQGWLHAKLTLVLILTAFHGFCARWRRAFAEDRNQHPARFYRIVNEIPTLLMIGIVILVAVKPF